MKRFWMMWVVLLLVTMSLGQAALAGDGDASLRFYGQFRLGISGNLYDGVELSSYSELFDNGAGFGAELTYRVLDHWGILLGTGYAINPGQTLSDVSLQDWGTLPVYTGIMYHFDDTNDGFNPYLRFDVGVGHLSSVDFTDVDDEVRRLWGSGWSMLTSFGIGMEYRFSRWGVLLELKGQYLGAPDANSLSDLQEADGSWTIPLNVGITYSF